MQIGQCIEHLIVELQGTPLPLEREGDAVLRQIRAMRHLLHCLEKLDACPENVRVICVQGQSVSASAFASASGGQCAPTCVTCCVSGAKTVSMQVLMPHTCRGGAKTKRAGLRHSCEARAPHSVWGDGWRCATVADAVNCGGPARFWLLALHEVVEPLDPVGEPAHPDLVEVFLDLVPHVFGKDPVTQVLGVLGDLATDKHRGHWCVPTQWGAVGVLLFWIIRRAPLVGYEAYELCLRSVLGTLLMCGFPSDPLVSGRSQMVLASMMHGLRLFFHWTPSTLPVCAPKRPRPSGRGSKKGSGGAAPPLTALALFDMKCAMRTLVQRVANKHVQTCVLLQLWTLELYRECGLLHTDAEEADGQWLAQICTWLQLLLRVHGRPEVFVEAGGAVSLPWGCTHPGLWLGPVDVSHAFFMTDLLSKAAHGLLHLAPRAPAGIVHHMVPETDSPAALVLAHLVLAGHEAAVAAAQRCVAVGSEADSLLFEMPDLLLSYLEDTLQRRSESLQTVSVPYDPRQASSPRSDEAQDRLLRNAWVCAAFNFLALVCQLHVFAPRTRRSLWAQPVYRAMQMCVQTFAHCPRLVAVVAVVTCSPCALRVRGREVDSRTQAYLTCILAVLHACRHAYEPDTDVWVFGAMHCLAELAGVLAPVSSATGGLLVSHAVAGALGRPGLLQPLLRTVAVVLQSMAGPVEGLCGVSTWYKDVLENLVGVSVHAMVRRQMCWQEGAAILWFLGGSWPGEAVRAWYTGALDVEMVEAYFWATFLQADASAAVTSVSFDTGVQFGTDVCGPEARMDASGMVEPCVAPSASQATGSPSRMRSQRHAVHVCALYCARHPWTSFVLEAVLGVQGLKNAPQVLRALLPQAVGCISVMGGDAADVLMTETCPSAIAAAVRAHVRVVLRCEDSEATRRAFLGVLSVPVTIHLAVQDLLPALVGQLRPALHRHGVLPSAVVQMALGVATAGVLDDAVRGLREQDMKLRVDDPTTRPQWPWPVLSFAVEAVCCVCLWEPCWQYWSKSDMDAADTSVADFVLHGLLPLLDLYGHPSSSAWGPTLADGVAQALSSPLVARMLDLERCTDTALDLLQGRKGDPRVDSVRASLAAAGVCGILHAQALVSRAGVLGLGFFA